MRVAVVVQRCRCARYHRVPDDRQQRQRRHDAPGLAHTTHDAPLERQTDGDVALDRETHDEPDAEEARHVRRVDDRLAPAGPVDDVHADVHRPRSEVAQQDAVVADGQRR